MKQVLLLELNEINFDAVRRYASLGKLPSLASLVSGPSVCLTTSENNYHEIEPWIQWVTAHTGLSLAEHGVYRLGDIMKHDFPQIWETLEEKGVKVGAISPMNAKNRTKSAAFFVPDPWTSTSVTGSFVARNLYRAICQVVNDNAQSRVTAKSAIWLTVGAARYSRVLNYLHYLSFVAQARRKPWAKALFLDLFLADMFIKMTKSSRPGFATLFLNAGAHIQHHYMFSSEAYDGPERNPDWYVDPQFDPVFEVYDLYDRIVGQVSKSFPDARIMIATGLHQDPHEELTYYWRLRNHAGFLGRHNVPFASVEPKMSRDFNVACNDAMTAVKAEVLLNSMRDLDGVALFEVDNRGKDLFVMLTYPNEIADDFVYTTAAGEFTGFKKDVAFVAIKNGQHNGIGYFVDSEGGQFQPDSQFPLSELCERVEAAVLG